MPEIFFSFITFADYLMIDTLHTILIRSTDELLGVLKVHLDCLPDEEKLRGADIDRVLEEPRPDSSPQVGISSYPQLAVLDQNGSGTI